MSLENSDYNDSTNEFYTPSLTESIDELFEIINNDIESSNNQQDDNLNYV
jgi:hypothetical protein